MAVRHGYGKIAGTDALVFAYDTGDTRNSYRGEPTTNIIADPLYALGTKNAYYDTNNTGWGTVTRGRIEEVIGPFGKPVQAYSQELISYNSSNRNIEGQPQEVVDNANCLFNLTVGTTYRISVWIKATYTGTSQNRLYLSGTAAVGDGTNRQVTVEWQRFSKTFSPSTTGNYYMRHYDYSTKETGAKIWYALPQVEIDKGHDTQFTTSTRSSTQGLLDLTGNSTIDLSNVSFDSNAQKVFDGTNDGIDLGSGYTTFTNKSFAVEAILYPNTSPPAQQVFFAAVGPVGGVQKNIHFRIYSSGAYRMGFYSNDLDTAGGLINFGQYNHVVMQYNYDLDTSYIYVNGELSTSGDQGPFTDSSAQIGIGYWPGSGQYFNGEIPVTKVYSRILTADEIRNNYRHYKTRFDI